MVGSIDLQLVLDNQGAGCDNWALRLGRVLNDYDIVAAHSGHVVVLLDIVGLAKLPDGGKDAEAVEETAVVIRFLQGTQLVALWEGSNDLGGEEVGAEEAFGHGGVGVGVGFLAGLEGLRIVGLKGFGSTLARAIRETTESGMAGGKINCCKCSGTETGTRGVWATRRRVEDSRMEVFIHDGQIARALKWIGSSYN